MQEKRLLRAVDLCCGAGGWACAARYLPIRWVVVVDWAPDCLETWQINHAEEHPDCKMIQADLSTDNGADAVIKACSGESIDLVVGGIPCEELSIARANVPVSDERMDTLHSLIDRCLSIVDSLQPAWWAIEDVIVIEKHLPLQVETGMEVPLRRLDAGDFGPQNRIRTFLGKFPKPVPVDGPRTLADVIRSGPYMTVPGVDEFESTRRYVGNDKVRLLSLHEPAPTITSILKGSRQRRRFIVDDTCGRRVLSLQETALLQGFPENYRFVSCYTRTEKMIIQSISIYIGRAIFKAIVEEANETDTMNKIETK